MRRLVTYVCLIVPLLLEAQEMDCSIEGARDLMLRHSAALKAADAGVQMARKERGRVNALWWPQLQAEGAYMHLSERVEVRQPLSYYTDPLKADVQRIVPGEELVTGLLDRVGQYITPKIIKIFKILLPTTFPTAISAVPFNAAVILTAASGALVPMATMVRPTTNCGIPIFLAIPEVPSTNQSAPFINIANPKTNNNICKKIMIILLCFACCSSCFVFQIIVYKKYNILCITMKNFTSFEGL